MLIISNCLEKLRNLNDCAAHLDCQLNYPRSINRAHQKYPLKTVAEVKVTTSTSTVPPQLGWLWLRLALNWSEPS